MSDIQSKKEFEHFHRSGVKNLELEKATLERKRTSGEMHLIDQELLTTLQKIIWELNPETRLRPDVVFPAALRGIDAIDAKRFLLNNLLEALKSGKDLKSILENYKRLGLMQNIPAPAAPVPAPAAPADASASLLGKEIQERQGILKRFGLALAQVAVNAFKSIPKWIEIEPQLTLIGGLIPILSFSLKGKGMSIDDLFETLRAQGASNEPN